VQLDGSVAIVTGASRGIGAAVARALVEHGVRVVAVSDEHDELTTTAASVGAEPFDADVRDPAHADAVVAHALAAYGHVDIVVANAGIGHAGAFADMPADRIADLLAVNVRAPMLLARAALPHMLEAGRGSLVVVSSIAGALLVPRETVYSASKAALDAFAEPLREELRGTGVTVSTIVPAVVRTGFFDSRGEPYTRRFPRPISPDRVADAVLDAITRGTPRRVVPRWFIVPIRIRGIAPTAYRALARRFG
jgi:short-subunit dehydrogenase